MHVQLEKTRRCTDSIGTNTIESAKQVACHGHMMTSDCSANFTVTRTGFHPVGVRGKLPPPSPKERERKGKREKRKREEREGG